MDKCKYNTFVACNVKGIYCDSCEVYKVYQQGRADQKKKYNEFFNFEDAWKLEKQQIRANTIDECADKFADILSNIPGLCGGLCPVKCNWGTEENCKTMCKKWLLEQLKEQNK